MILCMMEMNAFQQDLGFIQWLFIGHILPCTLPLSSPKHSERDILYVPQDISEAADVNINCIQFHACPKL
jgi:hypothetical protein